MTKFKILKEFRYLLETPIILMFYLFFKLIPIDLASWIGGKMLELLGPYLKVTNIARKNLKMCFPDITDSKIEQIVKGMWNNLGRILGETPNLNSLNPKQFIERTNIQSLGNFKKPALYLSGHLGNFELAPKLFNELKNNVHFVYRPINNRYLNCIVKYLRQRGGNKLVPKGVNGLMTLIKALNNGQGVGMLVDQKMNDGIDAKFFGINAKTTSLPAKLAIKYKVPIYVMFLKRLKGCNYEIIFKELNPSQNDNAEQVTQQINDILESWIKQYPQQWFWVHRRWGKVYQ